MRAAAGALFLLLAGGAGGAPPIELPARSDSWFRLKTANFTVFSNTTESRAREIALDLERLRAVLLSFRRGLTANSPVPTYLYVFKNGSAMEPYLPLVDGKPKKLDAYFQATDDGNYIALAASWNSDPRRLIYHEYLHYFMHANFRPQPLWYDEGTADFYSSFRATDSEAQIGLPVEEYIALLRGAKMIPLEELFDVDHQSPYYNEDLRRDVFYAESWALVHYLLRGAPPERKTQLARFLVLLQEGTPRDAAFREAFRTDYSVLLGELYSYVRQSRYNYARVPAGDLVVSKEVKVEPLSRAETLFRLGDLLLHAHDDRTVEAEAYFHAALDADPGLADAETGLGVVFLRRKQYPVAAEHFRKATASERADYRAFYYDARLRLEELSKTWSWPLDESQRAGIEAARAALRRSIALNPDYPEARADLGRTYLVETSGPLDEGIEALTTASKLLPSRKDVAEDLAKLEAQRRETEAAPTREERPDSGSAASSGPVPTPYPGSRTEKALAGRKTFRGMDTGKVNALLAEGKEDEAVAAMEELVAHAPGESRPIYQDELTKLKAGVARNKAVRAYNAAIALYNRREYPAALQAFEKLAAASPDTEWGKKAADRAKEIHQLLGK